jgi:hypothetical protein
MVEDKGKKETSTKQTANSALLLACSYSLEEPVTIFILVSYLAYSLTWKMGATSSYET